MDTKDGSKEPHESRFRYHVAARKDPDKAKADEEIANALFNCPFTTFSDDMDNRDRYFFIAFLNLDYSEWELLSTLFWKDPAMVDLPSACKAKTFTGICVKVENPKKFRIWLDENRAVGAASLVTNIEFQLHDASVTSDEWCELFTILSEQADNLDLVQVRWMPGEEYVKELPKFARGRDKTFIEGLSRLKVKKYIGMWGFYAQDVHAYLEKNMNLTPFTRMRGSEDDIDFRRFVYNSSAKLGIEAEEFLRMKAKYQEEPAGLPL